MKALATALAPSTPISALPPSKALATSKLPRRPSHGRQHTSSLHSRRDGCDGDDLGPDRDGGSGDGRSHRAAQRGPSGGRPRRQHRGARRIKIRRRPITGPSVHHVGPFHFRLENEGNTPRNILEKIVWNKDVVIWQMKEKMPLYRQKGPLDNAPPARDFVAALKASYNWTALPALIAEVKKASPSWGVLRENFDPVSLWDRGRIWSGRRLGRWGSTGVAMCGGGRERWDGCLLADECIKTAVMLLIMLLCPDILLLHI